jgi:endonuclease YncB( thermonuclease family)
VTTDRYGRTVAFVKVGDTLVNEELIREGLAWVLTRYCDQPICQQWKKLEDHPNGSLCKVSRSSKRHVCSKRSL